MIAAALLAAASGIVLGAALTVLLFARMLLAYRGGRYSSRAADKIVVELALARLARLAPQSKGTK